MLSLLKSGLVINTLETLLFNAIFLNSSILPKMGTPNIILPLNEGLSSNIPTGYNSSFESLSNIFLKTNCESIPVPIIIIFSPSLFG